MSNSLDIILFTANILVLLSMSIAFAQVKNVLRFILCLEIITFCVGVLCAGSTGVFHTTNGVITTCVLLVGAAAETAILLALIVRNYKQTEAINLNDYRELRG